MKKSHIDQVINVCVPIMICILWGTGYALGWNKLSVPVIGIYCLVNLLDKLERTP